MSLHGVSCDVDGQVLSADVRAIAGVYIPKRSNQLVDGAKSIVYFKLRIKKFVNIFVLRQ